MREVLVVGLISGLLSGVIASFLASWLFLKFMRSRRPNIALAPVIAHTERGYLVRIKNAGQNTIFDVRCEAELVELLCRDDSSAPERRTTGIPLTKPSYLLLSPYDAEKGLGLITFRMKLNDEDFLMRLKRKFTADPELLDHIDAEGVRLEALLNRFDHVRVRVFGTDWETGTSNLALGRYWKKDIVDGLFAPQSLEMVAATSATAAR